MSFHDQPTQSHQIRPTGPRRPEPPKNNDWIKVVTGIGAIILVLFVVGAVIANNSNSNTSAATTPTQTVTTVIQQHTTTTVAAQPTPTTSTDPSVPTTSTDGGPCDGNPCIGDWQKEAAEGGTVVQCTDGTWSHAGGLSGACSDHGGEATDTTTTPETTPTPVTEPDPTVADWPTQCGYGLASTQDVSCGLANSVFYEYYESLQNGANPQGMQAWSPATQQYYGANCVGGDGVVTCTVSGTTDPNAAVGFTQASVDEYTPAEAAAYAKSHPQDQ